MDKRIYITIILIAAFTLYQIYATYQAIQAGNLAGLMSPIMYLGIIGLVINQLMISNLNSKWMRKFTLPQVINFSISLLMLLMFLFTITLIFNIVYGILFSGIFSALLLYSAYTSYQQTKAIKNQYGIK
ncbi:hypothetical protein [Macrococcus bovicus]|uniref:hypothetical protein n=1 Tax=Macrococcus bovicus TaxID=69968 RepID=UPI0025A503A1|nr:hypothetical protein [Macrococcus bovicus]WJP98181.1 hypothetical protein QSV55_02425 [Macrococcus bovicus]